MMNLRSVCFLFVLLLNDLASSDHNISLQHACLCSVSCGAPLNDTSLLTNTSSADPTITTGPVCLLQNVSYTHNKPDQERQVEQVTRLCFYANTSSSRVSQCSEQSNSTIPLFPGQLYTINILTADRLGEYLPQPIIVQTSNSWQVGRVEQVFGENSSEVSFSIASNNIDTSGVVQFSVPTYDAVAEVSAYLKNCPIGFDLDTDSMTCQCSELLSMSNIVCDKDSVTLEIPYLEWIGLMDDILAYTSHCIFGNCDRATTILKGGDNVDIQCTRNRTGVGCGRCANGYSTVLGDSSCMQCSHWYLLTILMYMIAGIILVCGIFALDLTISRGTVIAPIFVANIYLSSDLYDFTNSPVGTRPFVVTVSLLGLSLGFPLCFFDGMTDLQKAVLEFAFPLYIISIVVVIIIVSRYSQLVSKLVSHSSVKALATLIFLSYGKLLKSVFDLFQYNTFFLANGQQRLMWHVDENVGYFELWHAIACVFATVVFLTGILPYTVLITLGPFLLRWRLIARLKPFMDAHSGPYKDRYRYWFGVRLWIIVLVAILNSILSGHRFKLFFLLGVILNAFTIIEALVQPYKKRFLNCIDTFSLLLLTFGFLIIAMSVCFNETIGERDRFFLISFSVIGFLVFGTLIAMIAYHLNDRFQIFEKIKSCYLKMNHKPRNGGEASTTTDTTEQPIIALRTLKNTYDPSRLREPVLSMYEDIECSAH